MAERKRPRVTEDDLKRLPPDERLRVLRELQEQRRRELEDQQREAEAELRDAETLSRQTEEELEESLEHLEVVQRQEPEQERPREEREDLEERLAGVQGQGTPGYLTGAEYATPGPTVEEVAQRYRVPGERERSENPLYQSEMYRDANPQGGARLEEGYLAPSQQREGVSLNILKDLYRR